jgi:hypothetical protein
LNLRLKTKQPPNLCKKLTAIKFGSDWTRSFSETAWVSQLVSCLNIMLFQSCGQNSRQNPRFEGRITQNEYDEKARTLKRQQVEIAAQIEQHQTGDDAFRATLEALISVASRAAGLFERSKAEQKRKLLSLVFSSLRLNAKKLDYTMRSPFDLMVKRPNHASWLGD